MSYLDMKSELVDEVPAMSRIKAGRLINRAWRYVQDSCLWSFQLGIGGFSTPQVTTAGSISVILGQNTITGDLAATQAWNALPIYWSPTLQQIRATGFSIYSVIAQGGNGQIAYATIFDPGSGQTPGTYIYSILDTGGPGTGGSVAITVAANGEVVATPVILTSGSGYVNPYIVFAQGGTPASFTFPQFAVLTLDRPFVDPLPEYSGVGYQMFLAYIAAPPHFKRWLTVADMFNAYALDIWTSRRTEDLDDPTRLYTSNPWRIMGLGQDQRGAGTVNASATLGQQLYELWPNPQSEISYQTYYVARAPKLVNNSDELPDPITDEVVVLKALSWAYRDAEARRDIMAAKGTVGNFLGLKNEAEKDFLARLKTLRLLDRDAVDSYMVSMRTSLRGIYPYFNSVSNRASMGLGPVR